MMRFPQRLKNITPHLLVAAGACMLLWPAFFNGYPILNADDNTYLQSGFLPDTPIDRPITYGLLLRIFSANGVSLWLPACFQALLMSWLLNNTLKQLLPGKASLSWRLLTLIILAAGTSLPWICSELMPDFFTTVAWLSLAIVLIHDRISTLSLACYLLLYTISVATHLSHVLLFSLAILSLLAFRKMLFTADVRRQVVRRLFTALLLTIGTIAIMGSALSKSKHVFFTGSLLQRGILQPFLEEHCKTESYKLCNYQAALKPDPNWFLWAPESPLYKTGGWQANKEEHNSIITGTLTERKYVLMNIRTSLLFTGKQMEYFGIGDGYVPFTESAPFSIPSVNTCLPTAVTRLMHGSKMPR